MDIKKTFDNPVKSLNQLNGNCISPQREKDTPKILKHSKTTTSKKLMHLTEEKAEERRLKNNENERIRTHAQVDALNRLARALPPEMMEKKRWSKQLILSSAISYIRHLHSLIENEELVTSSHHGRWGLLDGEDGGDFLKKLQLVKESMGNEWNITNHSEHLMNSQVCTTSDGGARSTNTNSFENGKDYDSNSRQDESQPFLLAHRFNDNDKDNDTNNNINININSNDNSNQTNNTIQPIDTSPERPPCMYAKRLKQPFPISTQAKHQRNIYSQQQNNLLHDHRRLQKQYYSHTPPQQERQPPTEYNLHQSQPIYLHHQYQTSDFSPNAISTSSKGRSDYGISSSTNSQHTNHQRERLSSSLQLTPLGPKRRRVNLVNTTCDQDFPRKVTKLERCSYLEDSGYISSPSVDHSSFTSLHNSPPKSITKTDHFLRESTIDTTIPSVTIPTLKHSSIALNNNTLHQNCSGVTKSSRHANANQNPNPSQIPSNFRSTKTIYNCNRPVVHGAPKFPRISLNPFFTGRSPSTPKNVGLDHPLAPTYFSTPRSNYNKVSADSGIQLIDESEYGREPAVPQPERSDCIFRGDKTRAGNATSDLDTRNQSTEKDANDEIDMLFSEMRSRRNDDCFHDSSTVIHRDKCNVDCDLSPVLDTGVTSFLDISLDVSSDTHDGIDNE